MMAHPFAAPEVSIVAFASTFYMLLSVVRRFITIILLAVPAIALILVLTHRVTGAAYDQATAVITLSSVANFGWVTVGFIRWLLQQEKKVRH